MFGIVAGDVGNGEQFGQDHKFGAQRGQTFDAGLGGIEHRRQRIAGGARGQRADSDGLAHG